MIAPGGYPLGVLPSPADERDYRFPVYGRVLKTADLPTEYACDGIHAVDDQGSVNSCVAHSLGLTKDWQEYAETGFLTRHSRQFIYAYRPNQFYHKGPGMIPREALATLRKCGVPRESVWPGIVEYGKEVWPADEATLRAAAAPFKVESYVSIDHRYIPEVKSAIFTTGPILYCVPVHQNFTPDSEGRIPMPSGVLRGYHAMTAIGWRHGAWLVQNSWSASWGKNGRCWIPWEFPALEVWGITDAPTERKREVLLHIGSKTMLIDGFPVEMDVAPYIKDGRTMLPVRFVGEAFGATFDYGPKIGAVEWVKGVREESPW